MEAGTSPAEREFFGVVNGKPEAISATLQRPISTKVGYETKFGVLSRNPERHFRKFWL